MVYLIYLCSRALVFRNFRDKTLVGLGELLFSKQKQTVLCLNRKTILTMVQNLIIIYRTVYIIQSLLKVRVENPTNLFFINFGWK